MSVTAPELPAFLDIAVIGGGQSAHACAYYLRRSGLSFALFDDRIAPGGAWQNSWDSLTLFSTNDFSNLPGMPMPKYDGFPPYVHVIEYLSEFERRFSVPVLRPTHVDKVTWEPGNGEVPAQYVLHVGGQQVRASAVISATGTRSRPFVPHYPGTFQGVQLHGEQYKNPEPFLGKKVAVVGGANSGAQIAADLVDHVDLTWYTTKAPRWMPDDVDGRVLFQNFHQGPDQADFGDIVMVPPVRAARDAGKLTATPMFRSLGDVDADYLIWCTGYRPALSHLNAVVKQREAQHPGLYLVGYGNWCGMGSATLAGVGPFAREAAAAAQDFAASARVHIGETTKPRR